MIHLQKRLGYRFSSPELLLNALTHSSYANEMGIPDNERLEFLGDTVLQMVVTRHLFGEYPHLREGQMTRVRAAVVRKESLAQVAEVLDLGEGLRLGKGQEQSGRHNVSILADAMEAVIGAVYTDGGWKPAERLIMTNWREMIDTQAAAPDALDAKTQLQELLATEGKTPQYRVTGEGPGHARRFEAEVWVDEKCSGTGEGPTHRLAEQQAARSAIETLFSGTIPA
ncbi:MAG: ribonuclease III, partial [Acidimicrobiia bacterium]|nr:ribonuclease III [Acidimicrobiia bacterium]